MLIKARIVLVALILMGGYAARPETANASTYLNNYKVRVTIDGVVATGGQVNWTNYRLKGSSFVTISSTGYAVFPRIVREADLTIQGIKIKGPHYSTTNSMASLEVVPGLIPIINFVYYYGSDYLAPAQYAAEMPDGTRIPGVVISSGSCYDVEWKDETGMFGSRWTGDYVNNCTNTPKTATNGAGIATHFALYSGADNTQAIFTDGLIDQVITETVTGWSTLIVPAADSGFPITLTDIADQYVGDAWSWGCQGFFGDQCDNAWIMAAILAKWDQIQPGVTHTEADVVPGVEIPVRTGLPTFVFEQMPVIDLTAVAETVNYGAAKTITATARNANGSPISGRSLTLSASVSGASASCSGRKTTATTNSSGRATFKVCPVKTATWSVDGRSIVGSAGVRLTVQLTPTAPRTLVAAPKTRSVSLTWVVPVKANASAVSDYVVQYRVQGASTWVTFRDGTNTARKATVTGLTSGQVYEFRVTAKNKSGAGTWSGVVLGTPN
jgi:hypothetical protein